MGACVKLKFAALFLMISCFAQAKAIDDKKVIYSTRIFKSDGQPNESTFVSFRFTLYDPSLNCTIYVEEYQAVNMRNTDGFINFILGNGTQVFPNKTKKLNLSSVLSNNRANLDCQETGITYEPEATDQRRLAMQYTDGTEWRSVPTVLIVDGVIQSAIENLNLKMTSYLPSVCSADSTLHFNNVSFSCIKNKASGVATNDTLVSRGAFSLKHVASRPSLIRPITKKLASVVKKQKIKVYKEKKEILSKSASVFEQSTSETQDNIAKKEFEPYSEVKVQIGSGFSRLDSEYLKNSSKATLLSKSYEYLQVDWLFFLEQDFTLSFDIAKESLSFVETNSLFNQNQNLNSFSIEGSFSLIESVSTTFIYNLKDYLLAKSYQPGSLNLEKTSTSSVGLGLKSIFLKKKKISVEAELNYNLLKLEDSFADSQIKSGSEVEAHLKIKQSFKTHHLFLETVYSSTHVNTDFNSQHEKRLKASIGVSTDLGIEGK